MKLIRKLVVLEAFLLLIYVTSNATLAANQRNGVHSISFESIGPSLAEAAMLTIFGAFF